MGLKLHNRIEIWKKMLLDFGKRNRLINFLEGKRSNVKITTPSYEKLWEFIVINEREINFPYARYVTYEDYQKNYKDYKPVHYIGKKRNIEEEDIEEGLLTGDNISYTIIEIPGDITTNRNILDLETTLKVIRNKAIHL